MRAPTRDAVRVGRTVARHSSYRVIYRAFTAVATSGIVLAAVAMALVFAQYTGAQGRGMDRSPRDVTEFTDEAPQLLWVSDTWVFPSGRQAAAVVISPLTQNPPLPPGVDTWPSAGQAVVSAAWEARKDALPSAYAGLEIIGTIAPDGLVDNGEILAYVGADRADLEILGAARVTGFGTPYVQRFGADLYRQSAVNLVALVGATALLPAGFLVISALRIGAGARARREELYATLGASAKFAAAARWGEASAAVVTGIGAAAALTATVFVVDLPLPGVGYSLRAADNRTFVLPILAAFLIGALIPIALARTRIGLRAERPLRKERWAPGALVDAIMAPFVAAAVIIAFNLSIVFDYDDALAIPLFLVGIVAATVLLPRSIRGWLCLVAQRGVRVGWDRGEPALLVASRQILARPRPYGRLGGVAATAIVLLCVLVRFVTVIGDEAVQAERYLSSEGLPVGTVSLTFTTFDHGEPDVLLTGANEALSREHNVVGVRFDPESWTTTITGSPEALAGLGLAPGTGESSIESVRYALGWASNADTVAEIGEITARTAESLMLMRKDGAQIDRASVDNALAPLAMPPLHVDFPGETWVMGAAVNEHQARWLVTGGMWAMLILTAALWASYANELVRIRQGLLPAQILAPTTRFTRAATFRRIVIPVTLSAIMGMTAGLILSLPLQDIWLGVEKLPWSTAVSSAAIISGSSLVAWLLLSRNVARSSITLRFEQSRE